MFKNSFFIQFAKRISRGRNRRAANQPEVRIARGLELREPLLRDALDVAHREKSAQMILVVHDVNLVVGPDQVFGFVIKERSLFDTEVYLGARRQRINHLAFGVARLDHVAGKQADQFSFFVHDGKCSERKFAFLDDFQNVADELIGRNARGFLDQTVDVVFHAADFGQLLALRHIVMNQTKSAVERHRNRHARFGDGVHVG